MALSDFLNDRYVGTAGLLAPTAPGRWLIRRQIDRAVEEEFPKQTPMTERMLAHPRIRATVNEEFRKWLEQPGNKARAAKAAGRKATDAITDWAARHKLLLGSLAALSLAAPAAWTALHNDSERDRFFESLGTPE